MKLKWNCKIISADINMPKQMYDMFLEIREIKL